MSLVDLRNYIKTQKGYAFKSKWFKKKGIPIVKVKDFTDDSISRENVDYINDDIASDFKKYILAKDDVIIQTVGSWASNPNSVVGKAVKVPELLEGALLNQNAVKIIPIEELDKNFLYYTFRTDDFKGYIINTAQGAASQASITLESIKNYKFYLPPLQTQKRIADILSAYDDLIENNLKRIKLLEQSAQNIYKEWFVNMRFPKHGNTTINEETGLPEGWEEVRMEYFYNEYIGGGWGKENFQKGYDKKAHVIRGTDFNKIKSGSFESTPLRFHKESNLSSRRLDKGDLILEVSNGNLSKVGDVFLLTDDVFKVLGTDIICASFCKMLRPKTVDKSIFIYHYIIEMNTSNLMLQYKNESAAGINNFNFTSFLSKEIVVLPSQQLLSGFYNIVSPIHEQISKLRHQIQKLKAARDILLPRLMNRTIEV